MNIRCPRCARLVDVAAIASSNEAQCPSCHGTFAAVRFDAPLRNVPAPESVGGHLESAQPCANHPHNAAVTNCERCGSYMCALCRIDVDQRTLCPTCFERLSNAGELHVTRTVFRDYDGIAGVMATFGCLTMAIFGVLFGPLAIYYGVRALRQRKRFGEMETVVGAWIAIVLGTIEAVAGLFFFGSTLLSLWRFRR